MDVSPFHAGESAVQQRAGVREQVEAMGARMIRDFMPQQHRDFFAQLPTLLVGSVDAQGRPWASMLAGRPGFMHSPDEQHLHVAALTNEADPLARQLAVGAVIGLLGIEPRTRRRNRLNGRVVGLDAAGFSVEVEQSFGNCPKYIQAREPQWVDGPVTPTLQALGARLSPAALALVRSADTLFIASAAAGGADVSHRGGRPGFVQARLDSAGRSVLAIPDFSGNNLFNTLGNIAADGRAGLLFVDHARGDLLQLSGHAHIVWDGAELRAFAGARRLVEVRVDEAFWRPRALPLRWSPAEQSPHLAATGTWPAGADPAGT